MITSVTIFIIRTTPGRVDGPQFTGTRREGGDRMISFLKVNSSIYRAIFQRIANSLLTAIPSHERGPWIEEDGRLGSIDGGPPSTNSASNGAGEGGGCQTKRVTIRLIDSYQTDSCLLFTPTLGIRCVCNLRQGNGSERNDHARQSS